MEIALNGESKRKTAVAVALTEAGERSDIVALKHASSILR